MLHNVVKQQPSPSHEPLLLVCIALSAGPHSITKRKPNVQLSLLSPLLHLLCVSLLQILLLFVCPPSLFRNLLADYCTLQPLSLPLLLLRLSLPLLFRLFA